MENRQSYVIVGAVTLLLLLTLLGFAIWLSRFSGDKKDQYDIFFKQSVAGLSVGSNVSFSGVPVGQVKQLALMPESPEFVRVRIEVQPDVPILEGTTATLQGVGFTGVTEVQLKGGMRGQAKAMQPGPFGVPVIPSEASGFGQLLESAPQVLERASVLLARLNEVFNDENRKALSGTMRNLDQTTSALAAEAPALRAAIAEAQVTLKSATRAADAVARAGQSADTLLNAEGKPLVADLRQAITTATATLKQIEAVTAAAEPGVRTVATQTVPQVNQLVADLRDVSQQMGALAAKLDEDPLGALTGGRQLPDYAPEKAQ